jgi:hypothetical protein
MGINIYYIPMISKEARSGLLEKMPKTQISKEARSGLLGNILFLCIKNIAVCGTLL